jgi:cytochrome c-type biogenesis protein CcmF
VREDVYLVLAGLDETGTRAALKLFINPLQMWLWVGIVIMVAGSAVVIIPQPTAARSVVPAAAVPSKA